MHVNDFLLYFFKKFVFCLTNIATARKNVIRKRYIYQSTQIQQFCQEWCCISEHKIAGYLKLKKDDSLLVSSELWAQIWPEAFLKVQPEPKPGP